MISCGFRSVSLDYAFFNGDGLVSASFFDRSLMTLRSFGALLATETVKVGTKSFCSAKMQYTVHFSPVVYGKEKFYHAFAIREDINKSYFLSTQEKCAEDFYNLLMNNFSLPLLKEWSDALYKGALDNHMISYSNSQLLFGANSVAGMVQGLNLRDLRVYTVLVTDESLKELIRAQFGKKNIWISQNRQDPLLFSSMDEYFKNYGSTLVANLEKKIQPLMELSGNIDTVAFHNLRLYPQQIAQVNGATSTLLRGSHYAILNMGMGTGKTICSIAITENLFIKKYLKSHSGTSVKNIYAREDAIKYRNIVMCPGHLVKKWRAEILREVPYAKVEIVMNLSQLIELRAKNKERMGKEWYIVGKDFAKLSYQSIPIPTKVRSKKIILRTCAKCETVSYNTKGGTFECTCGNRKYMKHQTGIIAEGMVCPFCSEVLLPNGFYHMQENEEDCTEPLSPSDFTNPTSRNAKCHYCGTELWKPYVKNINVPGTEFYELANRNSGWHRSTHYSNKTHTSKKTVWVHRDYEDTYYDSINEKPLREKREEDKGVRKYAPAAYIKKYLKSFFDMFILDEAHLFKGGATAQGNAMQALVSASKYQLALTGTIAGGMATHLFYLLYRLDSARMKKFGYAFTDEMKFALSYGTVETMFDGGEREVTSNYNQTSRGRQLSSPKVKPGISPLIFRDFLLDKTVFLDLSDMSKFLPQLKEKIVTVQVENEIMNDRGKIIDNPENEMIRHYKNVIDNLKKSSKNGEGRGILSKMLQFSLSYPDHPYGVSPIKSPFSGVTLQTISDYRELIEGDNLLAKEKELVSIVRQELLENRNCVIYAEFTGSPETCVTYRLKEIIMRNCSLIEGQVVIIESRSPAAIKREEWMHQKAAEGAKVFIVQPRCVETGLDFCWLGKDGNLYNYPTLIFYQLGYSLFTVWQASKRAHRLNQREECRNYYIAYAGTVQEAVIRLIAEKQVATSAIQGKFSTEGLSAMAQGVDVKVKLAQAMADMDNITGNGLQEMFDVLNKSEDSEMEAYHDYRPMLLFKELVEKLNNSGMEQKEDFDTLFDTSQFDEFLTQFELEKIHQRKDEISRARDFEFDIEPDNEPDNEINKVHQLFQKSKSGKRLLASGQMSIFDC